MKLTKTKLRQIIKEELAAVLDEISVEDVEKHDSLLAHVAKLLQLSRESGDINEKEALMLQAREMLNQAAGVTQASTDRVAGVAAE